MRDIFASHNLFLKNLDEFCAEDPHLATLKDLKFVHPLDWWRAIHWDIPGIYILTGGRQIGKSTSCKLLIKHLLEKKLFQPKHIFYLPCDQVDDYHHLFRIIELFVEGLIQGEKFVIIVDEVTFVKEWDRAIKALADEGIFRNAFCLLTGSDSVILKEAASRFPGRRGNADVIDFCLHPLNFSDFVKLTNPPLLEIPEKNVSGLFDSFEIYQNCGGYLRAINDIYLTGAVRKATYLTFEQWIRGDFERRNKSLTTLLNVLGILYETTGTQVTYSALTQKMGHVVKETFMDYANLLERMGIIFALQAFDQNTKLGFPKKAKKIHFADPFIMDTVGQWLISERYLKEKKTVSIKVEAIVASNYQRTAPTYYLKAEGEIDVVVVVPNDFVPLEVKWTNQLRPQDLKQLSKYNQSCILAKTMTTGRIDKISVVPLPLFLVIFPRTPDKN